MSQQSSSLLLRFQVYLERLNLAAHFVDLLGVYELALNLCVLHPAIGTDTATMHAMTRSHLAL